jgi:CheY-like chemotaxis protein
MSLPLRRILLVDDSPRDTELVLYALADHPLADAIDTARDGVEALDYLYRRGPYANRVAGPPVVMLLDLKMPRLDGIEVLRRTKQDPQLKTIPVVVLTSSREEQDLVRSYQLGVNAYIVKPVQFAAFVEAVKQIGTFWAILNEPPPVDACSAGRRPSGSKPLTESP